MAVDIFDERKALASLTDAHTRVNMVGDVWLELRILRGLERCYLKLPDRFHVAKVGCLLVPRGSDTPQGLPDRESQSRAKNQRSDRCCSIESPPYRGEGLEDSW